MRRPLELILVTALLAAPTLAQTTQWPWLERTGSGPGMTAPPARDAHTMAYDAKNGELLVFGGRNGITALSDLWARDRAAWVKKSLSVQPPARAYSGFAYHGWAKSVILFGGRDLSNTVYGDTWAWNGTTWRNMNIPARYAPAPRSEHGMETNGQGLVLLFGGVSGTTFFGDSWRQDGVGWSRLPTPVAPSPRAGAALTFDSARNRMVLFGGSFQVGSAVIRYDDTWEFDGINWTQLLPPTKPSARAHAVMAYDAVRGATVLHGGLDGTGALGDTWIWNGTWTKDTATTGPSARTGHALAYDPAVKRMILFGGNDGQPRNDTWDQLPHAGPAVTFAGPGHPGGGLALSVENNSTPTIGKVFSVAIHDSATRLSGGGLSLLYFGLPLPGPAVIGPPATVTRTFLYGLPFGPTLLVAGNPGVFNIYIPPEPSLRGSKIILQGGALETVTTPDSFRASDAILITIQ